jgi:lambda repressor-like predicted transcriptional regulator
MKWKPQDIMAELVRRKITQTEIAEGLGKSPSAVHRVINGILVSDAIRQEIARRLGVSAEEIWPDYYLAPRQRPGRRRKAG